MVDRIAKKMTIKGKCNLTLFESGVAHIDNIGNQNDPIELNDVEVLMLSDFFSDQAIYGYSDGEVRPLYLQ